MRIELGRILGRSLFVIVFAGYSILPAVPAMAQSTAESINVRGQLRPTEYTSLAAGVARPLSDVRVRTGSSFSRGDVLIQFDCSEERAEKDMIQAKLDAATARLAVNERLEKLESVSGLDVELSRSEVAMTRAELRRTDAIISKCEITAPFDGSVVEKHVQAYQFVNIGEPLLEIVNPKSLEIEAVLPSQALAWIKPGQRFSLLLDETGQVVQANVDRLVSEVDPVSQTLRIFGRITPAAGEEDLLPGMSGRLSFENP